MKPLKSQSLSTILAITALHLSAPAYAQDRSDRLIAQNNNEQSATDPAHAALHGLEPAEKATNRPATAASALTGTTSLGVIPGLDQSLLVTPGAHPVQVSVPIAQALPQVQTKIDGRVLSRGKFPGWKITVVNNTDRAILIDGDAASILASASIAGAAKTNCVSMEKLAQLSVLPEQSPSFKKRLSTDVKATTTAALTLGWVQTIHDQKMGSGPIVAPNGGRYGLDEQRREDQLRRFGKRVLWPGDSSSGVIYFEPQADSTPSSDQNIAIDIPVASYYDKADQGLLKLRP